MSPEIHRANSNEGYVNEDTLSLTSKPINGAKAKSRNMVTLVYKP
jgi:hypothetical protein